MEGGRRKEESVVFKRKEEKLCVKLCAIVQEVGESLEMAPRV